jgi:pectinesterase
MKRILIPALLALLPSLGVMAADQLTVKAVNKLQIARASQMIELTAAQLAPLGEKNLNKIHVKDAAGKELICQAVDVDFDEYHTPDIVIFQSDFAPGETRTFTVTDGNVQAFKPEDYKAYGRFVRERFDDFAWENDLIAHRTYGKALETWKGEPLTSSSIDIWSKLHPTLIINEWYMMGDAYYHRMNSNGGDDYSAGATRGDGGNGLWANDQLWVSKNFVNSRTLASGPIRVMFELDYDAFDVNGKQVAETMRISLDAGSQMDHYQVTFKPVSAGEPLTAAVGLKKVRGDQADFNAARGALAIWEPMEKNQGMQGIAAIVDPKSFVKQAEDKSNNLLLLNAGSNNSVNYWAGFAWDKAGKITTADDWKKYVDEFAQGVQSPVEVSVSAGQ